DFPRIWPIGGPAVDVRGLEVAVPVAGPSAPASFPDPAPEDAGSLLTGAGEWHIETRPGGRRSVVIREAVDGASPADGARASQQREITATAVDGNAWASRLEAEAALTVTTPGGRHWRVDLALVAR